MEQANIVVIDENIELLFNFNEISHQSITWN